MPIATREQYIQMLDNAKKGNFAYPAINVVNLEGIAAAIHAFSEAKCDGMIQFSTGGAQHAFGGGDAWRGAKVLAEATHQIAEQYPETLIVLHTDHCIKEKVEPFLIPLIEESEKRVAEGKLPLFNSHMFDGSALPLEENLKIGLELAQRLQKIGMLSEVESGIVGGEEDGIDNSDVKAEKLYTTSEDMLLVYDTLKEVGRFMYAATFGNVHGVYKPGNVKLQPKILRDGQVFIKGERSTDDNPVDLVFHGGSGSDPADIQETLGYGVIKMNVDTDTQYSFTRPIVDHVMKNYDGMLRIEGEMGNKKVYDPRSYLKKGTEGMKNRILQAVRELNAEGTGLLVK